MKAIIFVAIMILGAMAVKEPGMDVIEKMEKHPFGNQLLNTIQLQIKSGDSADDLVHMLQDEEDKLEKEQAVEDKAILALQNQCVEDLKKLVIEIALTRKKIQQLTDLIKQLSPIKLGKEKAKKLAIDLREKIKAKLKEINEARDAKQAEWKKEAAEHDKLTAVIQQGRTILQSVLNPSFLQTTASARKTALMQLSTHFHAARKVHYRMKSITSIFRILAQCSATAPTQANEAIMDKIFGLIQALLDKIADSRAIEKADFDGWMKEYHKVHKGLTNKLQQETAKINQLSVDISVLTKRIQIAAKELKEQKVRLEQKIQQHDEREKECDAAGKKYAKDREARDDQRGIISDAIGLLVSKIRLLKRYVSERSKSLEKPFP